MYKFITILLSFMLTSCLFTNSFADSSIIYDILNKPYEQSTGEDIIYNIIGKKKTNKKIKIKVLNGNSISDELESENKKQEKDTKIKLNIPNKKSDKNAYIKGLDISKWNGNIDWDAVERAGIKFVIIRAGYGTHIDYKFEQNINNAIKHDMIIGVYWFGYAYTNDMAVKEAKICDKTIRKYKKHIILPVFYDYEYDSVNYAAKMGIRVNKRMVSSFSDYFCSSIKNKGYATGIYTNIDYANRYFSRSILNKYHTWIAQWVGSCSYKYNYIVWQCTDSYYINNKKYDLDYFYYNRYIGDK